MSRTRTSRFSPFEDGFPSVLQPTTPSQLLRYRRIIEAATASLDSGGYDALQLKEVADAAEIALSTLYRYFPSKERLIVGVALHRRRDRATDPARPRFREGSVAKRAAGFMLEQLRREVADPGYSSAVRRATAVREDREMWGLIEQLRTATVRHLVHDAGPIPPQLYPVAELVIELGDEIAARAGAGMIALRDARFRIFVVCGLFDLGEDAIEEAAAAALGS